MSYSPSQARLPNGRFAPKDGGDPNVQKQIDRLIAKGGNTGGGKKSSGKGPKAKKGSSAAQRKVASAAKKASAARARAARQAAAAQKRATAAAARVKARQKAASIRAAKAAAAASKRSAAASAKAARGAQTRLRAEFKTVKPSSSGSVVGRVKSSSSRVKPSKPPVSRVAAKSRSRALRVPSSGRH